ncbi:multi-sensor signal transduction histidine kinase [Fimbriimonas ginsengisoli Gsoil 348]|uniref:histidine kinase n=1 Tax=Fimbriimonas ginsengisoli Gsoil 348 TaxID=661478 RepID=A0A068NRF0_FIMGI|nr:multi-sensor signal transduction histidine kinase [Fimbriimonas ginsengisoli Gsoil 348]
MGDIISNRTDPNEELGEPLRPSSDARVLRWNSGPDGERTFTGNGWRHFIGGDENNGAGWLAAVHPADSERTREQYRNAVQSRERFELDFRLRRQDGEYRWMLDRGEPDFGSNGEFSGFAGAAFDLTDWMEARKRAERNEASLQLLATDLESFTYSVSHDLRAPLRSILGYSKILLDEYGSSLASEAQDMMRRQMTAARRMESLISDLLESSRLGRREVVRSHFDFSALARDVADEICSRDWGCEAKFTIEPNLYADADPGLLRYVLQNLFENAVKYSKPTGRAEVSFGRTPEGAFFVRDSGVGFDMEYKDKLFKAFERLHSSSEFPGTGIGLYNVQKVVHRHGGSVWADSAPGKGATFYFTLGER